MRKVGRTDTRQLRNWGDASLRRATGVRIAHMDIFAHDEAATNAPGQGGIQQGN